MNGRKRRAAERSYKESPVHIREDRIAVVEVPVAETEADAIAEVRMCTANL